MPSNTGNVWVIDDDESIRWVLEKGLSQSNINVSTFSNADDAIKNLKKEKIFYWIGQGSLLGIKRDNKLIEWDHDIDICVWHDDNSKDRMIGISETCRAAIISNSKSTGSREGGAEITP